MKSLHRLFMDLEETPSWGNGRDVKTLANAVTRRVFISSATKNMATRNLVIPCEELRDIMRQILVDRRQKE